jgi:hypothetical protein
MYSFNEVNAKKNLGLVVLIRDFPNFFSTILIIRANVSECCQMAVKCFNWVFWKNIGVVLAIFFLVLNFNQSYGRLQGTICLVDYWIVSRINIVLIKTLSFLMVFVFIASNRDHSIWYRWSFWKIRKPFVLISLPTALQAPSRVTMKMFWDCSLNNIPTEIN